MSTRLRNQARMHKNLHTCHALDASNCLAYKSGAASPYMKVWIFLNLFVLAIFHTRVELSQPVNTSDFFNRAKLGLKDLSLWFVNCLPKRGTGEATYACILWNSAKHYVGCCYRFLTLLIISIIEDFFTPVRERLNGSVSEKKTGKQSIWRSRTLDAVFLRVT